MATSDLHLTFRDGGSGDAGDAYTGLDRFGRLVETLWKTNTADKVRSQYGRNRFGGVVWRRDDQAHAQGVTAEDNYYWYDGLHQVKERQRGNLTGTAPDYTGITNLQQEEDWTYDKTGNWAAYDGTSPANAQTRRHNTANEITQIAASAGNVNPAYDPAGNMLALPKEPGLSTDQYDLAWDAWNRLVALKDGSTTVAGYTYDGLTRRLTKTNAAEVRHYYYNAAWRALEERVEGAGIAVDRQYTWGLRDRWDLLRRKRSVTGSLDEALYVLRDYLDPVALVDGSGAVLERYAYDTIGNVRILAPDYTSRPASDFDWNFLFHAEFLDRNTGLYNYAYRYYSPGLGRWLSRDPIEERGGVNLLAFVKNDPSDSIDALGLQQYKEVCNITIYVGHFSSVEGVRAKLWDARKIIAQNKAGCIKNVFGGLSCFPEKAEGWFESQFPNNSLKGLNNDLKDIVPKDGLATVSDRPYGPGDTQGATVDAAYKRATKKAEDMCKQDCCKMVVIIFVPLDPDKDEVGRRLKSKAWKDFFADRSQRLDCASGTWRRIFPPNK